MAALGFSASTACRHHSAAPLQHLDLSGMVRPICVQCPSNAFKLGHSSTLEML